MNGDTVMDKVVMKSGDALSHDRSTQLLGYLPLYVVVPDTVECRLYMLYLLVDHLDGVGYKEKEVGVVCYDLGKDLLLYLR